jgi:hypothetical protein
MADAGDRSLSREIRIAIRKHVEDAGGSYLSPVDPAEHDGASDAGQSTPSVLAEAEGSAE